jgi:hypothetical protein
LPVRPRVNEAGLAHDAQVPRRVRLTQARRCDELTDAAWPLEQSVEELAAGRLCHDVEYGRHKASLIARLYICQGMSCAHAGSGRRCRAIARS